MTTCKDCIHYGICRLDVYFVHANNGDTYQCQDSDKVEEDCEAFTCKSEWMHLPCKVGDTIYFDTYRRGENIGVQPHKVAKVEVIASTERQFGSVGAEIPDWQFGKTVFLTREEAEKALEERRKH